MAYIVYDYDGQERQYELTEVCTVIGRGSEAAIRFRRDAKVSHVHCQIDRRHDGFVIEPKSSKNRTLLNGKLVVGQAQPLKDGDKIRIGSQHLTYVETPGKAKKSWLKRLFSA